MLKSSIGIIAALGSAQTLGWGSTYYLPAILAQPIASDLGTSTGLVFAAFSSALIVAAALGPVAGRRIDRAGGRSVLAASSLIFASGLAILGLAQGPGSLFAAWLVIGVGMTVGLYEAAFATLAGIYGREARGAITGITLFAGFASTICWPISAYLEAEVGWRMACLVWAGAHLVIGLPLNLLLPSKQHRSSLLQGDERVVGAGSAPAEVQRTAMPLLAVLFAATWFISTAMAAHLPRLLQEVGASATAAVAAAALVGPAQVAGRMLEFGALQRFHPLLSARLATCAHPLGVLIVLVVGAPAASVFAILHGAGNGILTIAIGTLPLAIFGAAGYGQRQGLLMAPARIGQAGAPLIFALLIERYGASALLLSMALGLAGLCALLFLSSSAKVEHP